MSIKKSPYADYKHNYDKNNFRFYRQGEILPWTNKEEASLKKMVANPNLAIWEICDFLGRSYGSVFGKMKNLGLKRPKDAAIKFRTKNA